jgi:integrase
MHSDLLGVLRALPPGEGYVFRGPRGGRLKPDTVRRILVREVLEPLAHRFPSTGEKGFRDGRLHSFRHYFCSTCANSGVPERMVMEWLGHVDSEMVRHYYHLHDAEARQRMAGLDSSAAPADGLPAMLLRYLQPMSGGDDPALTEFMTPALPHD